MSVSAVTQTMFGGVAGRGPEGQYVLSASSIDALCRNYFGMGIPKGFSPPAQGWRSSANPGERQNQEIQPRRGCVSDRQAIFKTDTTLFRVANLISFLPRVG